MKTKMYCLKCKMSHMMNDKDITMKTAKNGRMMATAVCPMDGAKMTKFVSNKK